MEKKSNTSAFNGMRAASMLSRLEKMYTPENPTPAPVKSQFNVQVQINQHYVNRRP